MLWSNIQHGAKLRNLPVGITIEFAWNLYLAQRRKCALSGLLINFGSRWGEGSASLDRIDSKFGYVVGNVQWVHKDVNRMKMDLDQQHFLQLCAAITANLKG